jgi:hypothetical protein
MVVATRQRILGGPHVDALDGAGVAATLAGTDPADRMRSELTT